MKTQGYAWMLAACLLAAAPARAADEAEVQSFTLSNGLEVVVIPNHRIPAVSHMIWYRIGGGDDPSGKSGLAHYHEHMMFEGTPNHKPGDYSDIIARHGGQQNAFTGHDATSYYVNIPKDQLPLIMELEADRMKGIAPTDAGALKEKEVIIEERRMRIENDPAALLSEQMNAALYRNHPYHWPVIGWMNEMEGLTKQDVVNFHNIYYHPNNAVLIVSGDITAAEVKPLAQKYYGGLARAAIPPRHWNNEPPQIVARRITMHHPNVKQPTWSRSYSAASLGYGKKDESLPLTVASAVLGSGKTSRLYQSLVVKQKLASAVDVDYDAFAIGPSSLDIYMTPEPGVSLETLEAAMDKELADILTGGLNDEELKRARTRLKAEVIFARDGLSSMARIMGWVRMLNLDKDYFTRWPAQIEAVTKEQVEAALRDTLKPEQSVTGYLLPEVK